MVMSLFFCVRSGWEWDSHVSSVGCRTIVDCMHFSSVGALIIPFLRMHFSGAWIWPARGTVFYGGLLFSLLLVMDIGASGNYWCLWILVLLRIAMHFFICGDYGFWCCGFIAGCYYGFLGCRWPGTLFIFGGYGYLHLLELLRIATPASNSLDHPARAAPFVILNSVYVAYCYE